jgi:hypothetical protein
MNEQIILDGAGYLAGDYSLAVLITLSAFLTYARVAFEPGVRRLPFPRMVMAVGFTIWGMRFWYTLATGGDVIVAPISMIAIGMITGGYSVVQLLGIRRALLLERTPVFCLQDPVQHCQREDRIQEVIRGGQQ